MKQVQKRLIVVTRKDLKPGQQIAQAGHSISQFFLEHPTIAKDWNNNYLISLAINSEEKLINLLQKLQARGIDVSYFQEPDYNDALTSICFIESDRTKSLTSSLKLSLTN